jgi:hypothetical protein
LLHCTQKSGRSRVQASNFQLNHRASQSTSAFIQIPGLQSNRAGCKVLFRLIDQRRPLDSCRHEWPLSSIPQSAPQCSLTRSGRAQGSRAAMTRFRPLRHN